MTKIDDLISRGNLLGENWWAADADDIGTFFVAAANAREDIKAMRDENKRLRDVIQNTANYLASKGDVNVAYELDKALGGQKDD